MRKYQIFVFVIISSLLASGCMSTSTMQTAQTVEKGDLIVGGGVIGFIDNEGVGLQPEIGLRYGLNNKLDIGAKILGPFSYFVDAKFQFIEAPLSLSLDLGYSTFSYESKAFDTKHQMQILYPMIIVGSKHWYAGAKSLYIMSKTDFEFLGNQTIESTTLSPPVFVLGGIFGDEVRLLTEINIYSGDKYIIVPGVGVQFNLAK